MELAKENSSFTLEIDQDDQRRNDELALIVSVDGKGGTSLTRVE
jgi:hypothetical protein